MWLSRTITTARSDWWKAFSNQEIWFLSITVASRRHWSIPGYFKQVCWREFIIRNDTSNNREPTTSFSLAIPWTLQRNNRSSSLKTKHSLGQAHCRRFDKTWTQIQCYAKPSKSSINLTTYRACSKGRNLHTDNRHQLDSKVIPQETDTDDSHQELIRSLRTQKSSRAKWHIGWTFKVGLLGVDHLL